MANQEAIFDQVKAIFHDPDLRMWFDCIPQADCEELSFQLGEVLGSALVNRKDLKSNILQARTKVKDFVRKLFKGGGKKKALSRLNDSDTVKPATEPNLDPTDVGSGSAANNAETLELVDYLPPNVKNVSSNSYELIPYSGQVTPTSWPSNRGSLTFPRKVELQKGKLIDRIGHEDGTFVGEAGTPFVMRSLKPEMAGESPNLYRVIKNFEVEEGIIAPAFGYPGLGIQYELPYSVSLLKQLGFLENVE